jgi:hypothetical protein
MRFAAHLVTCEESIVFLVLLRSATVKCLKAIIVFMASVGGRFWKDIYKRGSGMDPAQKRVLVSVLFAFVINR